MKKLLLLVLFAIILVAPSTLAQVTPENDGDLYSISVGNLVFTVDASWGARVSSFTIDENEFMIPMPEEETIPCGCGSTVWPAPQDSMGFTNIGDNVWVPTPQLIDRGAYAATIEGDTMTFISEIDQDRNGNSMQIIKHFWADAADSSISMRLSLVNNSQRSIRKSIWELTRVPAEGIFFFPMGEGEPWGKEDNDLSGEIVSELNTYWYVFDEAHGTRMKWFSDGGDGWSGFVDESNHLFIKTYEDVPNAEIAPNEGELELWISDDFANMELEVLGAYSEIAVGETLHFNMKWYLRNLPGDITAEVGSQDLLDHVEWVLTPKSDPGVNSLTAEQVLPARVYPNPANDYLNIELNQGIDGKAVLSLYDISGKLTLSQNIEQNANVDLSQFTEGVYYYTINTGSAIYKGKMIKQ